MWPISLPKLETYASYIITVLKPEPCRDWVPLHPECYFSLDLSLCLALLTGQPCDFESKCFSRKIDMWEEMGF
jgi:hypothetical protein